MFVTRVMHTVQLDATTVALTMSLVTARSGELQPATEAFQPIRTLFIEITLKTTHYGYSTIFSCF